MALDRMRRGVLAVMAGAALLAAGCGDGTIESQFVPTRVLAVGDAFTDEGQAGGNRYTVNDGSINNWAQFTAANFGIALNPSSAGGTNYAWGNARVSATPDAAGNASTPTITRQVDTLLGSTALGASDLVIVQGGISDIIVQMQAFRAGTITAEQMIANVRQAGKDLAAQAKRLAAAGATHVVVVGVYDIGKTPWGTVLSQQPLLSQAAAKFNEDLLVSLVDEGQNMLYVDAALLFNVMLVTPTAYGMSNSVAPVCTSVDPGPGIGIGTGQLNSSLCTGNTVLPNVAFNAFLWADLVYPTGQGHRTFGEYAYSKITNRW